MSSQAQKRIGNIWLILPVILFFFFIFTTDTFAANRYWVGGTDGADYNNTANWSASDPASCTGGGASVPGASDVAIFDADCDNGVTVGSNWSLGGLTLSSGYGGNVAISGGYAITTTGVVTLAGSGSLSGSLTVNSPNTIAYTAGTLTSLALTVTGACSGGAASLSGSPTIASLVINKTSGNCFAIATGATLLVTGDVTMTDGYLGYPGASGTLEVQGNVSVGANFDNYSSVAATLKFSGANDQSFSLGIASLMNSLTIAKTGGTVSIVGDPIILGSLNFGGSGAIVGNLNHAGTSFTYTGVDVSALNLTVSGGGTWALDVNPNGTMTVASLVVNKTHQTNFNISGSDTLAVTGDVTLTNGYFNNGSSLGVLGAYGSVTVESGFDSSTVANSGALRFLGTADQNFTVGIAVWRVALQSAKTGGTATFIDTPVISGALNFWGSGSMAGNLNHAGTSFTYTGVDVSALNLTVSGGGTWALDVNPNGTMTVASLVVNKTHQTNFNISGSDTLAVTGDVNFVNGYFNVAASLGILSVSGNVTVESGFDSHSTTNSGSLRFVGSFDQTFTQGIASWRVNLVTTAKTSGQIILGSNVDITSSAITISSGATLDTAGYDFTISGGYTIASGGALRMTGGEATLTTPTLNTGSTVEYYGTAGPYTMKNYSYKNVTIAGATTSVFALPAAMNSWATTTITSGILSLAGFNATTTVFQNNGTLRLQGIEALSSAITDTDSGTFEYVGRNVAENLNVKDFGATDYYNLSINDTNTNKATFVLPSSLKLNGSFYQYSGTANGATTDLTLSGTDQTVSAVATTTFQTLTKSVTSADTLTFGTTSPIVISATTTLNGIADNLLSLRSMASGTQWLFDPQGVRVFDYLDVQDSYNINAEEIDTAVITDFVDSLNNTGWGGSVSLADIVLTTSNRQIATTTMPTVSSQDLGGAFLFTATGGSADISEIIFKQIGSLATTSLTNMTATYKLAEEGVCSATMPGGVTDFGSTDTFTGQNFTVTADTAMTVAEDSPVCLYLNYEVTGTYSTTTLGHSIDIEITNPSTDITLNGGTISQVNRINIPGRTIVSTDDIVSYISIATHDPAKNPTVFYLQNNAIWKKVGNGEAYRLNNPNLKVHSLNFTDMSGQNSEEITLIRVEMRMSNMDPGNEDVFMNVTRTLRASGEVRIGQGY